MHGRTVTEGTAANGLELERYRYEGIAIEALVHGNGVSIDLVANDYDPDLIGNMSQLVAKLVPNPANEVPTEAGYCIDRVYFRDPLKADQNEQLMMHARLSDRPDIDFMLILAAGLKPETKGLLERDFAAEARLSLTERTRVTKLRAGTRMIGGLSGEEVLRSVSEDNGAHVYNFWWEVNGTEADVFVPHLVFQMNTGKGKGGPVPSSLSEGAALRLWDRISSSIRLRPTTSLTTDVAGSAFPSRGLYADARNDCCDSNRQRCNGSHVGHNMTTVGSQLAHSVTPVLGVVPR
jgi:hypothetical protein